MKSRDYFEAFCREFENAQEFGPNAWLRSKEQEMFLRAKKILHFVTKKLRIPNTAGRFNAGLAKSC